VNLNKHLLNNFRLLKYIGTLKSFSGLNKSGLCYTSRIIRGTLMGVPLTCPSFHLNYYIFFIIYIFIISKPYSFP